MRDIAKVTIVNPPVRMDLIKKNIDKNINNILPKYNV